MTYAEQQAAWNAFLANAFGKVFLILLLFFVASILLNNRRIYRTLLVALFTLPVMVIEVFSLFRR